MTRLNEKLARMRAKTDTRQDFILADAKDADMAGGLSAFGLNRQTGRPATLEEFDAAIDRIIEQDTVDIILTSVSTMERLHRRKRLKNATMTPAVRLNDTTDLWRATGASYDQQRAIPFCTTRLDRIPVPFGLYSLTFSGVAEEDAACLDRYRSFRIEAAGYGVSHILEVFNPSRTAIARTDWGNFMNDMVSRLLAGMCTTEKPVFLKLAFNGREKLEALCRYDPTLIVGIMGGGIGTTRDCFELLAQAQDAGARAALFGRKILNAEHPPTLIATMRALLDGALDIQAAVHAYHERLHEQKIQPDRSLRDDFQVTDTLLKHD